jgi:hypothetical protein
MACQVTHHLGLSDALWGPCVSQVTAFYPNSDFYTYKGGVYAWDGKSAQVGGHALLVVGYNDAEGWWLAKNSCKCFSSLLQNCCIQPVVLLRLLLLKSCIPTPFS